MSLASWKAEYYPIDAQEAAAKGDLVAVEHSIRKWEGLTPENLARHGCAKILRNISDEDRQILQINDSTCSLCVLHYKKLNSEPCATCPIFLVHEPCCDWPQSPFTRWVATTSPHPMLRVLNQARDYVLAQAKEAE